MNDRWWTEVYGALSLKWGGRDTCGEIVRGDYGSGEMTKLEKHGGRCCSDALPKCCSVLQLYEAEQPCVV